MQTQIIILAVATMLSGCQKNSGELIDPTETLLTQKEWKLVSHGYDDNNNGIIEPGEEHMIPCENDNTYLFKSNGTGIFLENTISCTGQPEQAFTWRLLENNTCLDLFYAVATIAKISKDELVLVEETPIKYITRYRR